MNIRLIAAVLAAIAGGAAARGDAHGVDVSNTRYQDKPGISAGKVPRLALKWAFGFPNATSAYGQPTVMGGRVYAGSDAGHVYALDASTGCVYWSFAPKAGMRTAISVG